MNALANIKSIAKRELGAYFSSPVAYVFIVIFLLLVGFFTFSMGNFFEGGQANLDAFFRWHPWLYVFFVPCIGMRLWAEERRVGTVELLLTKPVTVWQLVVGKFLASWIFLGLALALTFPVVITVNYLGSPDNGVIVAAYLGSFLMAGTYLAISCMTSAMTRNQVISFIVSAMICLFLVLCGLGQVTSLLSRLDKPWLVNLVSSLSVMTHFQQFTTGLVDSRDVVFYLLVIAFALFTNGVIIRSHRAATSGKFKRRNFETMLYSTVGVAAMFVVMVSLYIVTSAAKMRIDVTADHAHTLSAGTKRILNKLDSRITIRFYCTQSEAAMPPQLRTYASHVEDLLREYQQEAKGKLVVEKFDPEPDSDTEDAARRNGMEGRPTGPYGSDRIYLGMMVSLLDEKFVLPWLAPDRERLLEYDVSRAIARVVSTRPVVGIMSGLPVFGQTPDFLMRPDAKPAEDWVFVSELKKDFTVVPLPLTITKIDEHVKVLLVVHPVDITDVTQYAIDQFLMRGGKLIAFLDPHAYFDQRHDRNQNYTVVGDNAAQSTLDKLLPAWGINLDVNRVVADTSFAGRNNQTGDVMPTLLLITRAGINENEVVTSQIDNLFMPFPGVFTGKPVDGLKQTVLVHCTTNSELVDNMIATSAAQLIIQDFKASNIPYPLAVRLTGDFKTAFPNGAPQGAPADANQLKQSKAGADVILVGDTDMLNDHVCVKAQNYMGHRVLQPMNGNLNFVQSLVEQFTGDDDLITARSRASMNRPFTRVKDMEAKASKQWEEKLSLLETRQHETEQKIRELHSNRDGDTAQSAILSPEQQQELDKYQETLISVGKDLKQVRKNLRRDTDSLEFTTKVVNIATMPVLVALSGIGLAIIKTRRRTSR